MNSIENDMPSKPAARVVCVLGMHRSGTSCLTGTLQRYGLHLGKVIDQAPHNLKGNKENKNIWKVNNLALSQSGGAWDNPPDQIVWNDEVVKLRDEFIASYNQAVWGFKDPRCLLVLPLWREALPQLIFCGTFRHPLAVALSLEKRNGFSYEKSLYLWSHYNTLLLAYAKELKAPLVCFDWPADKYQKEVARVATSLGFTQKSDNNSFFDDALRTNTSDDVQPNCILEEQHLMLYQQLCDTATKNRPLLF